jgi:hypothetical protein
MGTAAADHLSIHLGVVVEPFSQEITGTVSKPLWLLLAAVASVLLMACDFIGIWRSSGAEIVPSRPTERSSIE